MKIRIENQYIELGEDKKADVENISIETKRT